jgi:hypothetical protein
MARTVDASGSTTNNFYAPRPLINAEIVKPEHPVFYGYSERIMPLKYLGGPLMSVGLPIRGGPGPVSGRRVQRAQRPDARRG